MAIYLEIVGGLVLLSIGGELLVRGAVASAWRLGVSPLLIGITVVGFGTSTPELVTSVQAAIMESPGIAFGNLVGSNIANILFILALTALIAPIPLGRNGLVRDSMALIVSAAVLSAIAFNGGVTHQLGLWFIALILVYMIVAYFTERRAPSADDRLQAPRITLLTGLALLAAGLAGTIGGAHLLVEGSIEFSRQLGFSESLIGLSIVAVGTSLPELVASLIAAARRQSAIAFGNIVGSNIYNALAIPAVTGLVHPLKVPGDIAHIDLWVMVGATVALVVFTFNGTRLTRAEGLALFIAYIAYVAVLYVRSQGLF